MHPFQIGFCFAAVYEAAMLVRLQVAHRPPGLGETLWRGALALPGFLAFAFVAGVAIVWGRDSSVNHTLAFSALLGVWILALMFEGLIDVICRARTRCWWNQGTKRLCFVLAGLYLVASSLSALPYLAFEDETGVHIMRFWCTSLVTGTTACVLAASWLGFWWHLNAEEGHGRELLREILTSFAAKLALDLYGEPIWEQMALVNDPELIVAWRKLAERHRMEITYFGVERDGRLHPGLGHLRVPRHRLREIARSVVEEHVYRCDLVLRVADILTGRQIVCDEGVSWLRSNGTRAGMTVPEAKIESLRERRTQLQMRRSGT